MTVGNHRLSLVSSNRKIASWDFTKSSNLSTSTLVKSSDPSENVQNYKQKSIMASNFHHVLTCKYFSTWGRIIYKVTMCDQPSLW